MKNIYITIYAYNNSGDIKDRIDGTFNRIGDTPREQVKRLMHDIIDARVNDYLCYMDCTGDITNRIGRLIRLGKISNKNVKVITIDTNNTYTFDDKGRLNEWIYGFFDVENDDDLIDKI